MKYKSDYKENELKELDEQDFLEYGEPDIELDHLIHYDHRIFCYICKEKAFIHEAEKFAKKHRHSDLEPEIYIEVLDTQLAQMKNVNNPNLGE
jgi:hypothetical protein